MKNEDKGKKGKGGRPRKDSSAKLKHRITLKMAAADYRSLKSKASHAGVSASEFLRGCLRNGYVKERLSAEHSDYIRKLCGMANNLNQLARKAHASGFHEVSLDCNQTAFTINKIISCISL